MQGIKSHQLRYYCLNANTLGGLLPPTELGPLVKWLHAKGAESKLITLPGNSGIVHIIRAMEDALFGAWDAETAERCKRSSLLHRAQDLKRTLLGEDVD